MFDLVLIRLPFISRTNVASLGSAIATNTDGGTLETSNCVLSSQVVKNQSSCTTSTTSDNTWTLTSTLAFH